MHDHDEEELDSTAHLDEVRSRLRDNRLELCRTILAIERGRHTPKQIREVIARSQRLLYRSLLIKRRLTLLSLVH